MTGYMPHLWFDRAGLPIDSTTWGRLHLDRSYVRVARTTVASAADLTQTFDVSTVWLGVNHGIGEPPMIFETMVFGDGSHDLACQRYSTEEQARTGHTEMVVTVAATLDDAVVMDVD